MILCRAVSHRQFAAGASADPHGESLCHPGGSACCASLVANAVRRSRRIWGQSDWPDLNRFALGSDEAGAVRIWTFCAPGRCQASHVILLSCAARPNAGGLGLPHVALVKVGSAWTADAGQDGHRSSGDSKGTTRRSPSTASCVTGAGAWRPTCEAMPGAEWPLEGQRCSTPWLVALAGQNRRGTGL